MKKSKSTITLKKMNKLFEYAISSEQPSIMAIEDVGAFIQLCALDGEARDICIAGKWYTVCAKPAEDVED